MGIGAVSMFQPYIYNTNTVSANSLNPIKAISNDVTSSHINQTPETDYTDTVNPLAKGETKDFAGVLQSQMQMGMQNAMRIFGEQSVFAN